MIWPHWRWIFQKYFAQTASERKVCLVARRRNELGIWDSLLKHLEEFSNMIWNLAIPSLADLPAQDLWFILVEQLWSWFTRSLLAFWWGALENTVVSAVSYPLVVILSPAFACLQVRCSFSLTMQCRAFLACDIQESGGFKWLTSCYFNTEWTEFLKGRKQVEAEVPVGFLRRYWKAIWCGKQRVTEPNSRIDGKRGCNTCAYVAADGHLYIATLERRDKNSLCGPASHLPANARPFSVVGASWRIALSVLNVEASRASNSVLEI